MKPGPLIVAVAAVAFTTFSAISADEPPAGIPLRFVEAAEAFQAIKKQLGPDAALAVEGVEVRTNTVRIDPRHPEAAKIREFLNKIDRREPAINVGATIKRLTPATATAPARTEILARPTILGQAGRPMKFTLDNAGPGTIEVELLVTPQP